MKFLDTLQSKAMRLVSDPVAVSMERVSFLRKQVIGCCNGSTEKARGARWRRGEPAAWTCKSEDLHGSASFDVRAAAEGGLSGHGKAVVISLLPLFFDTRADAGCIRFFVCRAHLIRLRRLI